MRKRSISKSPAPKAVEVVIVVTPAVRMDRALESLRTSLKWEVEGCERRLAEWKEGFERNPSYAFEYSKEAFEQAAKLEVSRSVQMMIEGALYPATVDEYTAPTSLAILKEVHRSLMEEVVRRARWPENSSSFTSNGMSLVKNAQRTEMLVKVQQYLDRVQE